MASWLEQEARNLALLYRDGPEVWRELKVCLQQAIDDYGRIYSPEATQLQYSACGRANENCFRVGIVAPPDDEDVSYELWYRPDEHQIACASHPFMIFTLVVESGEILLRDKQGGKLTLEDASRAILTPLIERLPLRRPNIYIPPRKAT